MTLAQRAVRDAAIGVAVADTPDALSALLEPGCAAAIWRRHTPSTFQRWIDRLDPDHLPHGRLVVQADRVAEALERLCETAGTPPDTHRDQLIEDAAGLAKMFADLMSARFVRLRLDAISTNACRKFHIDALTARLICTYRGTGTQYGISTDGGDPSRIFTVPTGEPILLRGTLWPVVPEAGLLHRSPPIEGTGATRLVLVAAPALAAEVAM